MRLKKKKTEKIDQVLVWIGLFSMYLWKAVACWYTVKDGAKGSTIRLRTLTSAVFNNSTNFLVNAPKDFSFRDPFFLTLVGLGTLTIAARFRFKDLSIAGVYFIGRVAADFFK